MSGFSTDWLRLREPADIAARDQDLVSQLCEWAAGRASRVVDLGCGTGANWRALAPHLPNAEWLLVDRDPALLAEAERRTGARTLRADLSVDVDAIVAAADIVTASALFDLCSRKWIDRLAAALPKHAAIYGALTYDGIEIWRPAHESEPQALAAFHAHQLGDKGFGPSLGPGATAHLAVRMEAAGWVATTARSDWRLARPDGALIEALAAGAAKAVASTGALTSDEVTAWRNSRSMAHTVEIGHLDLLALPKA